MIRVTGLFVASAVLLVISGLAALAQTPRERERLVRQVRHEQVMLPYYGLFDNVSGSVTRPTLKGEAEKRVEK